MDDAGPCPDIVFSYMRTLVVNGTIKWITLLAQDQYGEKAGLSNVQAWHDAYPTENLIVMSDEAGAAEGYLVTDHWPTIHVLWYDGTWFSTDEGSYVQPLVDLYNFIYG